MEQRLPPKEKLNELFEYSNGVLTRKISRGSGGCGKPINNVNGQGYTRVMVDNQSYRAHRVIYTMHFGEIPEGMHIDHINGVRNDNRIENLRLATPTQNMRNRKSARVDSVTGVRGVYLHKKSGRFRVHFKVNGKYIHLGYFKSEKDASETAYSYRRSIFGDFSGDSV